MERADLQQELIRRVTLLRSIGDDPYRQAIALEMCRRSMILWIEDFCWTYDPRIRPSHIPIKLFPRQVEYLLWRSNLREQKLNGLTEKSRDVGLTWMNVLWQVHCWLFEPGFKGSFGSRKEELVDQIGNMDSIIEKVRFTLRNLPRWMLPKDFDWSKHDNFRKILNPNTGGAITGEAGVNLGRGGRSSVYDLDEAAFIDRPDSVDAALSNNANTIFYTSSVNGRNYFWKRRMSYSANCVFRFHWRDDPRKDDRWYEDMKLKYDPVIVASEIDLDYGASEQGIYIPAKYVEAAIDLKLPVSGKLQAGLDVSTTGDNKTVLGFRQGPVVLAIEEWQGLDTTQSAFKTRELVSREGAVHLNFDGDGVGAGIAGTLNGIPDLGFTFTPLRSAGSPSERLWPGENKTSKEKFHNARAEYWGLLFDRFHKTFNHVNGIAEYPLDELISIPNNATLIAQISQPKRKFTSAGKILVESKKEMVERGLSSPDYADALVYLFAPPKENEMEATGRQTADRIRALLG